MRKQRIVSALLLTLTVVVASRAQEDAPPRAAEPVATSVDVSVEVPPAEITQPAPDPVAAPPAEAAPPVELRDPFWPVGYKPPPPKSKTAKKVDEAPKPAAPVEIPPKWDEARKQVNVKGIMKRAGGYMAVINNQVCSENDTISTTYDGRKYVWRIGTITEKGVTFERLETSKL